MKIAYCILFLICAIACKKDISGTSPIAPGPDTSGNTTPAIPVDPPVANTVGFFLNDWQAKSFTPPTYNEVAMPAASGVTILVDPASIITKVSPGIFGNNVNPYMTQIVTEPQLISHIRNLRPNIIRFPGGNLSSVYIWNASPNNKPANAPDTLLNSDGTAYKNNYWYGKNIDSWTLSLDNYYAMLQQTNSQGMITVNYGYARYGTGLNPVADAAHLAADWVRYDNGRTKYWEVGNESNGTWQAGYRIDVSQNKDGQPIIVTGDLYGQHYKVFRDSMMKAALEIGKTIFIGAQLLEHEPAAWATNTDKLWNEGVLNKAGILTDYFIVHSYYTNFGENTPASTILSSAITNTKKMMDYYKAGVAAKAISAKPLALTEWNIFAEGSMQQVSNINGLHASIVLGELLSNKFGMASRWDLANGWGNGNDHGMFSNGDEPGVARWTPRPAFYHMYYFQRMLGDRMVASTVKGSSDILVYASSYTSGQVGLVIINKGTADVQPAISLNNFIVGSRVYWYTLTGGTDNGEFSRKVLVNGNGPEQVAGGPVDYMNIKASSATIQNSIRINVPARGAVYMVIDKK